MSGRIISLISGKGWKISRYWATAHLLAFYMVSLRTVMVLVGVSFSS